jgi:hypothetical protein
MTKLTWQLCCDLTPPLSPMCHYKCRNLSIFFCSPGPLECCGLFGLSLTSKFGVSLHAFG